MSATLHFFNTATNELVAVENEINMNQSNARDFCAALGMDTDFDNAPPMDIQEFQALCENYLAGDKKHFVDRGYDTVQEGNWTYGGRRPGYLKEKIELALSQTLYARLWGAKTAYLG